ncbi:MAG: phosphotransferase family protein [Halobellus sp.]
MSDTEAEVERPAIRAALAAARPDGDPVAIEPVRQGNRKQTRLVRFASSEPVVLQTRRPANALRAEATLLAAIRDLTSVPVPRVLAAGAVGGVAFLATRFVGGADLHERFTELDPAPRRSIVRSFGRHLANLHEAFRFRRFGDLTCDGDGSDECEIEATRTRLRATGPADFREWLAAYGSAAVERLLPAFDDLRADLRELLADPAVDPTPTPRLFPWDFRPGNALVADDGLAAVLDWERPRAADAALAFAKTEHLVADWYVADPGPLREAFRAGYASVRPVPDVAPVHRVVAVADSAVDSRGSVTNPRFPELDRDGAVRFHRRALERALGP